MNVLAPGDPDPEPGTLVCALVNNMPDAALAQTEAQFVRLLTSAGDDRPIAVRRYSLPSIHRSAAAATDVAATYFPLPHLLSSDTPLAIITGAEPVAPELHREVYWDDLARTLDWARESCPGLMLSCLAAHAAVWHYDGLNRTRLEQKCSGVFVQSTVPTAALGRGLAAQVALPHSRYNGVETQAMLHAGYQVVVGSEIGWGVATRRRRGMELLFQGHPEYDAVTLLKELRRDLSRWHNGETDRYPAVPSGYFDAQDMSLLADFSVEPARRDPTAMDHFPYDRLAERRPTPWAAAATAICRNWLAAVPVAVGQRMAG